MRLNGWPAASLSERGWDEQEETSPILLSPEEQQAFTDWARKEKRQCWFYRALLKRGWLDYKAHHRLCGFLNQLSSARLQARGDPRPLLDEAEQKYPAR